MADIIIGVVHGISMDDASLGIITPVSYIDARDLELTTGRVTIRVIQPGPVTDNALAGELFVTQERVQMIRALPTQTNQRDIDQSGGKLRISDKKYRMAQGDLKFFPKMGDQVQIVGDSQTFEVLAIDNVTQANAFIIWCRG